VITYLPAMNGMFHSAPIGFREWGVSWRCPCSSPPLWASRNGCAGAGVRRDGASGRYALSEEAGSNVALLRSGIAGSHAELTLVLFVAALFVGGFTHNLLLEAGVLPRLVKLIIAA